MNWTDKIKVTNEDNMELMKRYPDNYFDLAIVDPPYMENLDEYLGMQKRLDNSKGIKNKAYKNTQYDNKSVFKKPSKPYFEELFRVSKKQVIWGINYFDNFGAGRIIWNKEQTGQFNDCELAYQNISNSVRLFTFRWNGMLQGDMKNKENRIHPTQKPVKLYEWILMNYAKEGDKILDTHLGSGSIAIACHNLGYELTACELDKDYYEASYKRFKQVTSQTQLF